MINQYPEDFSGACDYFAGMISRVHGTAQVQNESRQRKRRISSMSNEGSRGRGRFSRGRYDGRGRGRRGGRGYGRGRGRGYGGRYGGRPMEVNGIDISDPTRTFTSDEWNRLGQMRSYIMQQRERLSGRTGRTGRGNRDQGGRTEGGRAVEAATNEQQQQSTNERGRQNGRGFGRGRYGH